jgi:purine-cytosine permease-like protein
LIKKVGLTIITIVFLGIYIVLALEVFSGNNNSTYSKNEVIFGSSSILGGFIFMSIVLMIVCNYFIDKYVKSKNKKRIEKGVRLNKQHK